MQSHRHIVRNIKDRLEALGLSATEASKRAGLAPTTLTRPLNDENFQFKLSTSTLTALCGPLQCDLSDLVKDDRQDVIHLVSTRDGLKIREAREALGWSQAELAAKAGTYQQMVDRIESGYVRRSALVPAVMSALGLESAPAQNAPRLAELLEQVEEINDLLHALDKVGDGIGGSDGFAVSAVAISAKSIADSVIDTLKAMGAKR